MANFTIKQYNGTAWVEMMPKTVAAQVIVSDAAMFISKAEKDSYALKADKNVAGGYAGLDAGGKILASQLPASLVGAMCYKGVFDAAAATAFPTGAATGDFYVVSGVKVIAGIDLKDKDHIIYNGTTWDKIDNTESVTSVNGATGAVSITTATINAVPTSDVVTTATANKILKLDANAKLVANVTGNADTATKLAAAVQMAISGDATGTASFDGSAGCTIAVALSNTGVTTAGTYTKVTVDAKGRVTSATNLTLADLNGVPTTRTVNGHALSANIALTYDDVGAEKKITTGNTAPAAPASGQFWYETA